MEPLSAGLVLLVALFALLAAGLWVARDDNARAVRERPAAAVASQTARGQAIVVGAAPTRSADRRSTGR